MAVIGMAGNWILEGNHKDKFRILLSRKSLMIFLGIFVVHIIGLSNTVDFEYALKDLRVKLPLLSLPLIIGTSEKLSFKETKLIFYLFILSIFGKSLIGLIMFSLDKITDTSQLAGAFSHIRYSLLINIAIVSALYYAVYEKLETNKYLKIILIFIVIWLSGFLFVLKSLTGIIVFFIIMTIFVIIMIRKTGRYKVRILFTVSFVLIFAGFFSYGFWAVKTYYRTDSINYSKLDKYTVNNNKYQHVIKRKNRENGHFVAIYICDKELEHEWNKRSSIKFKGRDKLNQNIRSTILRYLTSKNYRKDSIGIWKLNDKDIINIENGLTNYIMENKWSLYTKIYVALWEIENLENGGSAQKHSITQRFEFLRIASFIIKDNFVFGVGTGDVKVEFAKAYEKYNTKLKGNNRLRTHNQYVTFLLTFGIFGFILIFFSIFYSPYFEKKYKDFLFVMIFVILLLSMLNEDTFETQIGLLMFSFFYSVNVFGIKTENQKND